MPIPRSALPSVTRMLDAGVRVVCLGLLLLSLLYFAMHAALGSLGEGADRLLTVVLFYVGIYVASRRRWLNAELLMWLLAALVIVSMVLDSTYQPWAFGELIVYASIIPLLCAAFVPWRPTYSLLLIVPAVGAPVGAAELLGASSPMSTSMLVFGGVASGLVAAASNQFHRHLLFRVEQTNGRLVAAERMMSLGRLTAAMAHELKTPVSTSLNETEVLRRLNAELAESIGHPQVEDADLREIAGETAESLDTMAAALERAGRYLSAMRVHTVSGKARRPEPFLVAPCIDSLVTLLGPSFRRGSITVNTTGVDRELALVGDPGKLDQILLNLAQNAVDAMSPRGAGELRFAARADDGEVVITVSDDGPGVPDDHCDTIFEPLFTTKLDGDGTGLGLSICRDLAEAALGGKLRLLDTREGATFELRCPAVVEDLPERSNADEVSTWSPPQALRKRPSVA